MKYVLIFILSCAGMALNAQTVIPFKAAVSTSSNGNNFRLTLDKANTELAINNALKPYNVFVLAQSKTNDSLRKANSDLTKQVAELSKQLTDFMASYAVDRAGFIAADVQFQSDIKTINSNSVKVDMEGKNGIKPTVSKELMAAVLWDVNCKCAIKNPNY
jgi:cell division protein FtsB